MKKPPTVLLFMLPIFMGSFPSYAEGELKAGVGRVVITPKQDMWLSGYASRTAPSDGKIHDLYAKALAIEDESGAKVVIVTTDLIGLPRTISERTAELVREKFGLPRERLMLTSSHTHCGPVLRENLTDMYDLDEEQRRRVDEYSEALPSLLVEAVGKALADLEPCFLSWGVGKGAFAVNRRQYTLKGISIGVNPIGPVDQDVPVLVVARADRSGKAVLFGYACHNTTLSFQKICGDYAGFAQADVEQATPGSIALFVSGCGGDANPDPRGTLDLAERHGRALADAVHEVQMSSRKSVRGPLRAAYKKISLDLGPVPTREELERQTQDKNVFVQRRARRLLKTLDAGGEIEASYPYPVQVWQFSDSLTMIALGGEVVVDYSLRLKHELGKENSFVIAYANDVMAYIPSLRILREGGYEGGDAMVYYGLYGPWAPSVEETIIKAVHDLAGR